MNNDETHFQLKIQYEYDGKNQYDDNDDNDGNNKKR